MRITKTIPQATIKHDTVIIAMRAPWDRPLLPDWKDRRIEKSE